MKCPVCSNELYEYNVGNFCVDICRDGCSGMWFDKAEFAKCDQYTEPFPEELLRIRKSPNVLIDRAKVRSCPSCQNQTLSKVMIDPDIRFEIDTCPSCAGVWLDLGELEYIRNKDKEIAEMHKRMAQKEAKVSDEIKKTDIKYRASSVLRKIIN